MIPPVNIPLMKLSNVILFSNMAVHFNMLTLKYIKVFVVIQYLQMYDILSTFASIKLNKTVIMGKL